MHVASRSPRRQTRQGRHVTLYYGTRKTIVKDRRKEISPGLLSAMLHQLGLHRDDVR